MPSDGEFKWYYGCGKQPEVYYAGGDTREQTLAQAWSEYPEGGFSIIEGDKATPSFDCFRGDRVLEDYEEHNEECWGEDGAEIDATAGQCRELEVALAATLQAWMDKHQKRGKLWSFGETRNEEYFPEKATVADCPQDSIGASND
jgi:hypothetical protein